MKVQLAQVQWGQVILTSVLIVVLSIIVNLVLSFFVFRVWGQAHQLEVAFTVLILISSTLSILLTLVFAVRVARKVDREPQLHGLFVGLISALLLFLLSSGFQGRYVLVTLLSTVLTIAAGWFGGVLGSRGRKK